jgi:hypothetical protein
LRSREVRIPRTAKSQETRETPNEIEKKMLNGAMLRVTPYEP